MIWVGPVHRRWAFLASLAAGLAWSGFYIAVFGSSWILLIHAVLWPTMLSIVLLGTMVKITSDGVIIETRFGHRWVIEPATIKSATVVDLPLRQSLWMSRSNGSMVTRPGPVLFIERRDDRPAVLSVQAPDDAASAIHQLIIEPEPTG